MNGFILMLQFFTRLPIKKSVPVEAENFRSGSIYLPIVGLVIGLTCTTAYFLAYRSGNTYFAGAAAVLAGAMVTGALHLDGLADTCDGIFSSRPKDKILEIMKDSRIGTMGALAILFSVLLKVSLIWGLSYTDALYFLIITPVISRASLLYGIVIAKYPRENGLGKAFIGNITMKQFLIGLILCIMIVLPVLRFNTVILMALVFVTPQVINRYMESKIGGMTGDTLGALSEIQEVLCLIIFNILS